MQTVNRSRHDVVVVGARAAGAATAMLLARLGHDVVVVDRASFPSDTLSTHSIARRGVVQLHRWGLLDAVLASGAPAIRQVTFNAAGESVTRTIKDKAGVDLLVAPRRHMLDTHPRRGRRRTRRRRRATGVTVDRRARRRRRPGRRRVRRTTAPARRSRSAPGSSSAPTACGRGSPARSAPRSSSAAGAAARPSTPTTPASPWGGIEFFVAERALAGVFPTHDGEACVWVCMPVRGRQARPAAGPRRARRRSTQLLERTAPGAGRAAARRPGAPRRSPACCACPTSCARPLGPGWALVGDAGYHRDAVTGHGISDAFRDAELLAVALDQALRGDADETHGPGRLPAAARPGAARDLRPDLRAGGVPAGARRSSSCRSSSAPPSTPRPATLAARPAPRPRRRCQLARASRTDRRRHRHDHHRTTPSPTATASTPPPCSPPSTPSRQAPEAARFQFRAHNEWVSGTHSRSTHPRLLRRRRGAHPRAHLRLRRRPPRRARRAATTARPRWSTSCTRWPPA